MALDFGSGVLAGAAQLVVGHPFDTIKVKLQSQPKAAKGELPLYTGAFDATRKTLAEQGTRGLFKGMGAPLATVAIFNAVLFSARGQMERLLAHADGSALTPGDQFKAGLGAGVAAAMVACPTELIKCRLQAQQGKASPVPPMAVGDMRARITPAASSPPSTSGLSMPNAESAKAGKVHYTGPIDVAKKVLAGEGGIRGLYKGLGPTLAREVPGNAIMFCVYEWGKQRLAAAQGLQPGDKLGVGSLVLAGGVAGVAYWGPVYPADIIKSKIQIDDFRSPAYRNAVDCFRQTVQHDGIGGLYKGVGPAVVRAFPANAACFLVYELAHTALVQLTGSEES